MALAIDSRINAPYTRWRRWDAQIQGRIPPQWSEALKADPLLTRAVLGVDVVFGNGQRVLAAVRPLHVVSSRDGSEHGFMPLLLEEPQITSTVRTGEAVASARSISVTLPGKLVDPLAIIARGIMLAGVAEVALYLEGGDYEQRIPIIRGEITNVSFGREEEPISFEIVDPKEGADIAIPPWIYTQLEFPLLNPSAEGTRLPLIVNAGRAVPVPYYYQSSGDHKWGISVSTGWNVNTVYINGVATGGFGSGGDFGPGGVSMTKLTNATFGTPWTDTDEIAVDVENDVKLDLILTMKQIFEYSSTLGGGLALEPQLWGTARAKMYELIKNGGHPYVVINGGDAANTATAMQYVESTLLADYPMVSMVFDRGGYGPVVIDYRSQPVIDLVIGAYPLIERISAIQESAKSEIFNRFTVRYAFNPLTSLYEGVEIREPRTSPVCALSARQVGDRDHGTMELLTVQTLSMAATITDWMVAHFARPSYYIEVEAFPEAWFMLRRGDTVRLTEPRLNWTQQKAVVEMLQWHRGRVVVGFRVYPNLLTKVVGGFRFSR